MVNLMPRRSLFIVALLSLVAAACSSSETSDIPPTLEPQALAGQQVFTLYCASCHATQPDMKIVGPSLHGIATIAATRIPGMDAEAYLIESVLDPGSHVIEGYQDLMPNTFGKTLSGDDLDALITYLLTLK